MKYNTILLDFDGVVNKAPRYFSEVYAAEFGIDVNIMISFFEEMKDSANVGKADIKDLLSGVLDKWKWKKSVDELLEYWFKADCEIDERFRDEVIKLKQTGVNVYLATDQEKYRTEHIWNKVGLNEWLDGKFVSFEIGKMKSDPMFFQYIIEELNTDPNQIIFFDD